MNRPLFRSEGTNICNETVTNNNPAIFQNNRVLLNGHGIYSVQEAATNIYSAPQFSTHSNLSQMNSNSNGTVIATAISVPGGVTFTFQKACSCSGPNNLRTTTQYVQQQQPQQQQQQQLCQQQAPPNCNGNGTQIDYCSVLRQLEQHLMEKMMAQSQQQCKQYQLRFHCNAGTSTSRLYPCQENYKTTQTEFKPKQRECGCNCPPQLCIEIETSTTSATSGAEDHSECVCQETPINNTTSDIPESLFKCIKANSKTKNEALNSASNYIT